MPDNDGKFEVKVKHQLTKEEIKFDADVGDSIAAATERFGEEVVYINYAIGAKTAARNKLYALVHDKDEDKILTAEAALAAMADWKPTKAAERVAKDPVATAAAALAQLDPAARKAKLLELKALLDEADAAG
jgi:hypothetical protein